MKVFNIVTDDESCIYNYVAQLKQESTVWVSENEKKPTKVMRNKKMKI